MLPHRCQFEILCTLSRSSSSLLRDCQRNTCISAWGLVLLLQSMLLSCLLIRSILRRVHRCGRHRLLDGSVFYFYFWGLISRFCTLFLYSLVLLRAYQTPRELNGSN